MKRFLWIIAFICLSGMIACIQSCQKTTGFLDQEIGSSLTIDSVFTDSARTMDDLADLYGALIYGNAFTDPGVQANTSWLSETVDESELRWPGTPQPTVQVIHGLFGNPFYNRLADNWSFYYLRIREANIFLKNVDRSPLSPALKQRTKLEARFFRAYNYFILMEGWGGVPLINDTVYDISDANANTRATWYECVEYVNNELTEIAPQLPLSYSGLDYGRITRGACLALKSRLLLYAASPLYNGGSPATDPTLKALTSYPNYDPARWQQALQAAEDVVNLGIYSLDVDNETKPGYGFYHLFLERRNPGVILSRLQPPNKEIETNRQPPSRGGNFFCYPTQEMVDAFLMKNGLPITDPNSGYDPENPYANREPRFYYSITYNGSTLLSKATNRMEPVWTYKGAPQDGIQPVSSTSATSTGYYVRKMMDDNVVANGPATTNRCAPATFRYAEILLNLAEAANETGNTSLALDQLITIRTRAGIEPGADGRCGVPVQPSKDSARKLIHLERRLELAFENHRFWDLRRWKEGSGIDGQYMHGMQITRKPDGTFTYNRITTRTRYFRDNLYYLPIPTSEVLVSPQLLQNPGW